MTASSTFFSGRRCPRRLLVFLLVVACGRGNGAERATATSDVVLEWRDAAIAQVGEITSGPTISGSLQAATEAVLRAELAGTVVSVHADEGQRVGTGQLLARISDPTLVSQQRSAETAVRSAEISVLNARRDVERYETLVGAGASPRRDLETARTALASALAQLATARAQQADVQKLMGSATVQSPIRGIVSSRTISAGDVVQVGAEMFRIVDPSSMRLEASVPSDQLYTVEVGTAVEFEVRGYPGRTFNGRVQRINPTADPATRQVSIHVSVPNPGGTLVAGLFAEGRVTARARQGILIPAEALALEAGRAQVTRVRGGRAEHVDVVVGIEDEATRRVEIVSGLTAGDTVLVGPARETAPGTIVKIAATAAVPRESR